MEINQTKEELFKLIIELQAENAAITRAADRNAVKLTQVARWNGTYKRENERLMLENKFMKRTLIKTLGEGKNTNQISPSPKKPRPQLLFPDTSSSEMEE